MVFDKADLVQGGEGRTDLWIGAEDAARLGFGEGASVTVRNDIGRMVCVVRIGDVAPGCVQTYWPEANVLIAARWDPVSREPDYNAVVWIEAA